LTLIHLYPILDNSIKTHSRKIILLKENDMFKKKLRLYQFIILLLLICTGCSTSRGPDTLLSSKLPRTQRPYELNGTWYYPIPSAEGYIEEGIASWYGKKFHGRPTSNGEIFDMYKISAAHKTLPIGTSLKVTNLLNNKTIITRVNDRGPFVAGRIIDLSFKAAEMLGIVGAGTAKVKIEAVRVVNVNKKTGTDFISPVPLPDFRFGKFVIQVGSFKTLLNALQLKADLMGRYDQINIIPFDIEQNKFYRVQVGIFNDLYKAKDEIGVLSKAGHKGTFIVAVEN
jgi:rare lipoprotein A